MADVFYHSTREAETEAAVEASLVYREFQASQRYRVRPCFLKNVQKLRAGYGRHRERSWSRVLLFNIGGQEG